MLNFKITCTLYCDPRNISRLNELR